MDALELGLDEAFDDGLEDAFAAEGGLDEGLGVEGGTGDLTLADARELGRDDLFDLAEAGRDDAREADLTGSSTDVCGVGVALFDGDGDFGVGVGAFSSGATSSGAAGVASVVSGSSTTTGTGASFNPEAVASEAASFDFDRFVGPSWQPKVIQKSYLWAPRSKKREKK